MDKIDQEMIDRLKHSQKYADKFPFKTQSSHQHQIIVRHISMERAQKAGLDLENGLKFGLRKRDLLP